MRLDQEGTPGTISDLLTAFGSTRSWLANELDLLGDTARLEEAERAGSIRLYPAGLSTDEPVETDGGPYAVLVNGDLVTPDSLYFSTDEYVAGLIIVTGDLRAGTMLYEIGARVMVEGAAVLAQACFGRWGDQNVLLDVEGELDTPLLALDDHTAAYAPRGIRALIYGDPGWWRTLESDILPSAAQAFFRPEVLDDGGELDFDRAFAAARDGSPLLLPGVEESFPQRLEARPAVSG